ncbi:TlpA family protein disulfide reductase [bacterium]|nr:TlpA family protein disulfide reductase [bacterium]
MKKIVLLACVFIFWAACNEAKNTAPAAEKRVKPAEIVQGGETVKPEGEIEVKGLENEILGEDFEKGKNIHAFEMVSIKSGEKVKFGDFKGRKILVDFWASWCDPCIAMFPDINKLKEKFEDGDKTLKILSVSVDPMPGKIKKIIAEKNALFDVLQAPESLAESGVIMPTMVLADENGKVIAVSSGKKHSYDELVKLVETKAE